MSDTTRVPDDEATVNLIADELRRAWSQTIGQYAAAKVIIARINSVLARATEPSEAAPAKPWRPEPGDWRAKCDVSEFNYGDAIVWNVWSRQHGYGGLSLRTDGTGWGCKGSVDFSSEDAAYAALAKAPPPPGVEAPADPVLPAWAVEAWVIIGSGHRSGLYAYAYNDGNRDLMCLHPGGDWHLLRTCENDVRNESRRACVARVVELGPQPWMRVRPNSSETPNSSPGTPASAEYAALSGQIKALRDRVENLAGLIGTICKATGIRFDEVYKHLDTMGEVVAQMDKEGASKPSRKRPPDNPGGYIGAALASIGQNKRKAGKKKARKR